MMFMTVGDVQAPNSAGLFALAIMLLAIFGIVNFVSKRIKKKKRETILAGLEKGNNVVMINGMTGMVTSVFDDVIEVDISTASRARFMKWSINEIDGKKVP